MAINSRQNITQVPTNGAWSRAYDYDADGIPMDLTGITFGFVVRPNVRDATAPPLIRVRSDQSSAQGSITVSGNTVTVQLAAAATALLTGYSYAYALYWDPDLADQEPDVWGTLFPALVAAP